PPSTAAGTTHVAPSARWLCCEVRGPGAPRGRPMRGGYALQVERRPLQDEPRLLQRGLHGQRVHDAHDPDDHRHGGSDHHDLLHDYHDDDHGAADDYYDDDHHDHQHHDDNPAVRGQRGRDRDGQPDG